jgi:hypothetical protein
MLKRGGGYFYGILNTLLQVMDIQVLWTPPSPYYSVMFCMDISAYRFNVTLLFKYSAEGGKSALGFPLCRIRTTDLSNK